MGVSKEFRKAVLAALRERMSALGLRRGRHDVYWLPVADETIGTVGLMHTTGGRPRGVLEVGPVISVDHQGTARLMAEIEGRPFDYLAPAGVFSQLGYLTPSNRWDPFLFCEGEPIAPIADALAEEVRNWGLPFIREYDSLPKLVSVTQSGKFGHPMHIYTLPAALHLLGRYDESDDYLDRELASQGPPIPGTGMERYARFAAGLKERNRLARQRGCAR